MSRKLSIAMDFDDTYTAMPEIWDAFIEACKSAGHKVTIVTARSEVLSMPSYNHDIRTVCDRHGISVVYTEGEQKAERFKADIWIDDFPGNIPKRSVIEYLAGTFD